MNRNALVLDALSKPSDAIYAHLSQALAASFPGRHIAEVEDKEFDVEEFSWDKQCESDDIEDFQSQWSTHWWSEHHRIYVLPFNVWREVKWKEHRLEVLTVGTTLGFSRHLRHFVVGESEEVVDAFVTACLAWCSEVQGAVLVFQDGCWSSDRDLLTAISKTTLDTLILKPGFKESLVGDIERFLEMRDSYQRYGLPWKRGILLLGPPGNGKTHMIKGLVNRFKAPCLYVRNLTSEYGTDAGNIQQVFRRARSVKPCFLVFEDLDAMLNNENRSFFLNELDGFQSNDGLVTIASTNHPERLDPAILNRPSRFDRKFTFELPEHAERARYLESFGSMLEPALQLGEDDLENVAKVTEGYSFAYLKELYISSVMEWMGEGRVREMKEVMLGQASILAEEMKSGIKDEAEVAETRSPRQRQRYRGR